ncbi:MAG: ATP-binding cassette domain-containing protein [Maioricimonas sp. JB045]|uniref:ABC transporter ATP-binding protein n=1 Tax=Maioricimonas sp. JC845 TaxID=3232138 RepID=UPI00345AD09E
MPETPAILVDSLSHHYGERQALCEVSFSVGTGEIFGLLGPNGGGKTTLFRILGTLLPVQSGRAVVCGHEVASEPAAVRRQLGVTFQSPSLDAKLTVAENLKYQGYLYGLSGRPLRARMDRMLARVGLTDRVRDIVETLSGGLQRRVEIAKSLLHEPRVLLLDEPSTGLDPGARHDLWRTLQGLRDEGVTVLVTTHLMEEAERCDRLGILSQGRLVALGEPEELQSSVGGDCLTIQSSTPDRLADAIRQQFPLDVRKLGDSLRIESSNGHELVRDLVAAFPDQIRSIALGKPTLEDVFIQRTGHRFWEEDAAGPPSASAH